MRQPSDRFFGPVPQQDGAQRASHQRMPGENGEAGCFVVEHAFHAAISFRMTAGYGTPERRKDKEGRPFQIAFRTLEVQKKRVSGQSAQSVEKNPPFVRSRETR